MAREFFQCDKRVLIIAVMLIVMTGLLETSGTNRARQTERTEEISTCCHYTETHQKISRSKSYNQTQGMLQLQHCNSPDK